MTQQINGDLIYIRQLEKANKELRGLIVKLAILIIAFCFGLVMATSLLLKAI